MDKLVFRVNIFEVVIARINFDNFFFNSGHDSVSAHHAFQTFRASFFSLEILSSIFIKTDRILEIFNFFEIPKIAPGNAALFEAKTCRSYYHFWYLMPSLKKIWKNF